MIYLELDEVLAIACDVLGLEVDALVRVTDLGLADSAVARPRASFGGEEFYPSIEAKAASLLFGLARNHAFIDGNKRVAVLSTPADIDRSSATAALTRASSSHGAPSGPRLIFSNAKPSRRSRSTSRSDDRASTPSGWRSDQLSVSHPNENRCSSSGRSTFSHSGPEVTPPPSSPGLTANQRRVRNEALAACRVSVPQNPVQSARSYADGRSHSEY